MKKISLINQKFKFQENDKIIFEMPPFCSGNYEAIVKKDDDFGLYIDESNNYFDGCRDFIVIRNCKEINKLITCI
jgi:hypothetical protein